MLWIVATPLGNPLDITLRAIEILKSSPIIICESTKETSTLFKQHGISGKKYELLNEHTTAQELSELMKLCRDSDVALVSDCGTPGFHDPGSNLIQLCRKNKIEVKPVPGPSSLASIISLLSEKLGPFYFVGFLPQETEKRAKEWKRITSTKESFVLMDTPYRLKKILSEAQQNLGKRKLFLACDMTLPTEWSCEGSAAEIISQLPIEKAEFMLWVFPS